MKAILLFLVAVSVLAEEPKPAKASVRVTANLVDGSRLVGVPVDETLRIQTEIGTIAIGLNRVREIGLTRATATALLRLQNGDQITGKLEGDGLTLECLFGKVVVRWQLMDKAVVTVSGEGMLPPGEGALEFGGVQWTPWRVQFDVKEDRLMTLPRARPGFDYGHSGHGRGALVATNVGSDNWRNYRIECEVGVGRAEPAFNPYGLPPLFEQRNVQIHFHVADMKESWNDTGTSAYTLYLGANGKWALGCCYNQRVPMPRGHKSPVSDAARELAAGDGVKLDEKKGNRVRIDVAGERIQVWIDGEKLADVTDSKMTEEIGGQRLDHGGVAFEWAWECMGWVRDFSARKL